MSRIQRMGLAAAVALTASAQVAELAPAPRVEWDHLKVSASPRQIGPASVGGWLDTSNRAAVAVSWHSAIGSTENAAMGWTGSVGTCAAGDVAAAPLGGAGSHQLVPRNGRRSRRRLVRRQLERSEPANGAHDERKSEPQPHSPHQLAVLHGGWRGLSRQVQHLLSEWLRQR